MHWRDLWHILSRLVAFSAVVLAIYYGGKQVDETWYWYCFKFRDRIVYDALCLRTHGKHYGRGYTVDELASSIGRPTPSITASLGRLQKTQKAIKTTTGWFGKP